MESAAHITDANRERRVRYAAELGLMIQKSRTRNQRALDYGRYHVIEPMRNLLLSGEWGLTLEEAEAWFRTR